ncbi:MAG: ribosomal protein S18-alanine N-acetyltransferase [Clostridia bacterium]|nr:ribosomal protein S18-alanine N-acetyltransferase [Clostridia bacterium]
MLVLFVCTGNTCRSPMASSYLRSFRLPGLTVESRGLAADGSPASQNAVTVMKECGISLDEHRSKPLSPADLSADLFIGLSNSHVEILRSLGIPSEKILLLGGGIADPFGGDIELYRCCRNEIMQAVDALLFDGVFTPFCITPMTEAHLTAVAALEQECFSEPWSVASLSESLNAGTRFFVATNRDGTVLGYVGFSAVLDEGYFTNIAVTSPYRRQGVATLLMQRVIVAARELSLAFLSLEVRASNEAARRLYERFSFSEAGRRRNFYRFPTEDAIILTRRFQTKHEDFKH